VPVEEDTCLCQWRRILVLQLALLLGMSFLGPLNYAYALAGGAVSERAFVNDSIHHCHV
jgi:hypothetical protein